MAPRCPRRNAVLGGLLTAVAVLALVIAAAPASAIRTVEYRAGISQGQGGRLAAITAGPDGNLWFTEQSGRIGRITPAGVVTEFPAPAPLLAIAAGPDGAVWFSETLPDAGAGLGSMTVGGAARGGLPIGPPDGSVLSLVSGPDGALWFTLLGAGPNVGRMTTAGAVTRFASTYGPSQPEQIAVGPDGALWYAEGGSFIEPEHPGAGTTFRGLVRITTAGAITPFALRARGVRPFDLTSGPGGALWFTAAGPVDQIGRLTTAGAYTLFDARVPRNRTIGSIVAGPDRNLWYAINHGLVGRMTHKGLVTIFRTPSSDPAPGDLAVGPDGNIWMTDQTGGIVKIVPPRGRCVVPRVVGLRFASAKRRLRRANCRVGAVAAPRRAHRGRLVVQHQFPRRGARLPAEGAVDVMLRR
jgi:virginiamycin B lyase